MHGDRGRTAPGRFSSMSTCRSRSEDSCSTLAVSHGPTGQYAGYTGMYHETSPPSSASMAYSSPEIKIMNL